MTMLALSFLVITALLLGVMVTTVIHLPRPIQRLVLCTPAWLQAAVIHFGYGGWIGGVTGHLVGALLSIPWFFVSKFWLKPRLSRTRTLGARLAPQD